MPRASGRAAGGRGHQRNGMTGPYPGTPPVLWVSGSTFARMSHITQNQPAGTPTWIDLGIPDLDRAMTFYGALFGWEFDVGPAEFGHYTQGFLRGSPVAAIRPNPDPYATDFWWNFYFATDDCDAAAARARDAGGSVITGPMD